MKILITNDDGIQASGLKLLVEKAIKYGDVLVVAPKIEQSAKSHSINIKRGLAYQRVADIIPGVVTYTVDSTPADCVRFVNYHLKENYDIVFSGINHGFNVGEDIIYSGTVAGASEAIFEEKKAIAFSTKHNDLSAVELAFDEVMSYILDNGLLDKCNLYNVNIPLNPKGIKITHQGSTHFDALFYEDNGLIFQKGYPDFSKDYDKEHSDVFALYNGYISITPLTNDRTNHEVFQKLKK